MLKPALLLLLPALFASHAMASTVEFCPNPKEIQNTLGVLTVKTESGEGEWVGVLRNPKASITAFDSAIFYSYDNAVEGVGRLRACRFASSDNQMVDMHYRPDVAPDISIRLAWAPAWEKKKGAFGSTYFECRHQDLQGCAFKEAK
ncbi:DUF3757 domain-containing protein [Pseudomonas alkylphenolica]|nr:DUF3757 domain-containing protein [Pseudomonas alkylphenolica]